MKECIYLATCPFVKYCNENNATTAVKGFIALYCKGEKIDKCIRKQLCEKFSRSVVPPDMIPNGLPLPGKTRANWSEQALNFRKLL